MDLSQTITPKSDQLNADDLMAGPLTVTITRVHKGNSEQPVNVGLAEFPRRPFKPSKSMRRLLVAAWGKDSSVYEGRSLTLFRNPDVTFGGEKVGGIQISHMSHLDKPLTLALTVRRGKRAQYTVEPLTAPASPASQLTDADIAACTDVETLRAMWSRASTVQQEQITARANQLTGEEKTND